MGGAIALVKEGDSITIDADKRLLQLNVPEAELKKRRAAWKQPKPRYTTGVMAKYAHQVSSAEFGAVTDRFEGNGSAGAAAAHRATARPKPRPAKRTAGKRTAGKRTVTKRVVRKVRKTGRGR